MPVFWGYIWGYVAPRRTLRSFDITDLPGYFDSLTAYQLYFYGSPIRSEGLCAARLSGFFVSGGVWGYLLTSGGIRGWIWSMRSLRKRKYPQGR